jgi:uncharacterized protein YbjT (DUF2867 family)
MEQTAMKVQKMLITGATGATGGSAIKKLLKLKIPVRALVHKTDARSEHLSTKAWPRGVNHAHFLIPGANSRIARLLPAVAKKARVEKSKKS